MRTNDDPGANTGIWLGGRLFENDFGEVVFLPLYRKREDAAFAGPLRFLGDGQANLDVSGMYRLTNPVDSTDDA